MMGPFLMLIGIGLLYVAIKGKSDPFITQGLGYDIGGQYTKLSDAFGSWAYNNIWKNFSDALRMALPSWLRGPGLGPNQPNPINPPSNPGAGIFPCPDNPNAPCITGPDGKPLHLLI